jgi:sugar phosphate isomerase/epimerase
MKNMTSLSRRAFLAMAGAAPFAATAFAQTKNVPIGIELYSVRGELQKDLWGTVRSVAKMGYQVVEFYSPYFDWTPERAKEIRKLLDGLGIKCLSTHNSPTAISPENIAKAIDLNKTIGSKYIIIASPPKVSGEDGWKGFADQLTKASEKLRAESMATGFHNHQLEFRPMEGGGKRPMEILAANTPKDVVLQLDAGTSVEVGADPVAWIKSNPGRIKSIHLKDWGKANGYAVAFGEGEVPWKGIFQAAESVGGIEYYLIEQERAGADGEIAMAQRCLDNYKKMRAS